MNNDTPAPLWPAQLDHLCLASPDPDALAGFYARALGMTSLPMTWPQAAAAAGAETGEPPVGLFAIGRRLVVTRGAPGARPWHAYRLADEEQLERYRVWLDERGVPVLPSPSPWFGDDAFSVLDPDGWRIVFGLPRNGLPYARPPARGSAAALTARLQHVVVASADVERMFAFYASIGFRASDFCLRDPDDPATRRVGFYRSDPDHHSFAVFGAPGARADHHAYETACWNDIRDWADHLAAEYIPIWWGPGRHGPGNNLFFMIRDPDEQAVEFSAELERVEREHAPRDWPLDDRSLNLWGNAWQRE